MEIDINNKQGETYMLTEMKSIDGKRTFFLGYVDTQLKLACESENLGDYNTAWKHFQLALEASNG
jgi:hypothetical protein